MSFSILSLQQNGDLQKIKDRLLGPGVCIPSSLDRGNISLKSFGGLFIVIVVLYVVCIYLRCLCFRRDQTIAHWLCIEIKYIHKMTNCSMGQGIKKRRVNIYIKYCTKLNNYRHRVITTFVI